MKYTENEIALLKVMQMNQDDSLSVFASDGKHREIADNCITESEALLNSLKIKVEKPAITSSKLNVKIESFEDLANKAEQKYSEPVGIENLLDASEINDALNNLQSIEHEFSKRTSIINKTDLSFLMVATAIQTGKSLLFPLVAKKFEYGESFDKEKRLAHNDKSIEEEHRRANDEFRDKHQKKHKNDEWINIIYRTPPYDITKGSKDIGFNMEGAYHRYHTLGHDPILGWIFGTANILTDVITLNNLKSFRVERNPMRITPQPVSISELLMEAKNKSSENSMNLPAAVFAQYRHLKSDEFTKCGLPVPIIEILNEDFAGQLYKNQYDALCFSRDVKIIGFSAMISILVDIIIGLVHGLFYDKSKEPERKLYEVRTRKILLISNCIASGSSVISSAITGNPKNLDIGGLFVTLGHLFTDIRFIARVKQEFIEKELYKKLENELKFLDSLIE